jgi:hypothetical protein
MVEAFSSYYGRFLYRDVSADVYYYNSSFYLYCAVNGNHNTVK